MKARSFAAVLGILSGVVIGVLILTGKINLPGARDSIKRPGFEENTAIPDEPVQQQRTVATIVAPTKKPEIKTKKRKPFQRKTPSRTAAVKKPRPPDSGQSELSFVPAQVKPQPAAAEPAIEPPPTTAMRIYRLERKRRDNTKLAVRRNAEFAQAQRHWRLKRAKALGESTARPSGSSTPWYGIDDWTSQMPDSILIRVRPRSDDLHTEWKNGWQW